MEENEDFSDPKQDSSPPPKISYVRRADRTPEKDFHLKSEDNKKVVCQGRSMLGRVRNKIARLEDEVEEREKEVETERQLRVEAEQRLHNHIKDMYGNLEVNQELRERLPRANKSDPFKQEEVTDTDLSSIEEQIVAEEEEDSMSKPQIKSEEMKSLESQILSDKTKGATGTSSKTSPSSPRSPKASKRSLKFSKDTRPKTSPQCSEETQTAADPGRFPQYPYTNMAPPQGFYGHAFGVNPYLGLNGGLMSGNYHSPLLHSTSIFPQSSFNRPMSTPVLNTNFQNGLPAQEPLMSHSLSVPTQMSSSADAQVTAESAATKFTPGAIVDSNSLQASPDSGFNFTAGSRSFGPSIRSPLNTSLLPDPFRPSVSPRLQMGTNYQTEQNKQITSLLNEIDTQKIESKKMQDQLAAREQEIETLKLTLKAQSAEQLADASETEKAAGLVEQVYAAQKKRDEATNGRMKLVNQERDDVMERLRQLEMKLDSPNSARPFFDHSDDDLQLEEEHLDNEDVHLLMSHLDSPSSMDNDASAFVRKVELMRHRQREVINEEMQIVMEQRDVALARCRKLEVELLRYQKESEADGGMDKSLKAKLAAVQQERDVAVAKSKQLDDEIQTIRLYYSLHKSLSREDSLQQQANNTITAVQEDLTTARQELEHAHKENNHLVSQLRSITIDKKQLEEALAAVKQDKDRLQRLATVLKRKLNTMNNEPTEEDQH